MYEILLPEIEDQWDVVSSLDVSLSICPQLWDTIYSFKFTRYTLFNEWNVKAERFNQWGK